MDKKCYNDHNADRFKIEHEPLEDYKLFNMSCAYDIGGYTWKCTTAFCDHCIAYEKLNHWISNCNIPYWSITSITYKTSDNLNTTKEEIVIFYNKRVGLFAKAAK